MSGMSLQEKSFLTSIYSGKDRHYHDINHINKMLLELEQYLKINNDKELSSFHNIIERAIWFHDIVCIPLSAENEYRSSLYVSDCPAIAEAILATGDIFADHSNKSNLVKLLLDLDIVALGTNSFEKDTANILLEYEPYVTISQFKEGRKQFFEILLSKNRLYYNDYFYKLYEETARNNMKNYISLSDDNM